MCSHEDFDSQKINSVKLTKLKGERLKLLLEIIRLKYNIDRNFHSNINSNKKCDILKYDYI